MGKEVTQTHITERLGVNAFEHYCLKHDPLLIWRETRVSDFGIDGEIELVEISPENKKIASGKIIKIQLKSTSGSYMGKDKESEFEFNARKEDIEYWLSHDLMVVLVIYDIRDNTLYAKNIEIINKKKQ